VWLRLQPRRIRHRGSEEGRSRRREVKCPRLQAQPHERRVRARNRSAEPMVADDLLSGRCGFGRRREGFTHRHR